MRATGYLPRMWLLMIGAALAGKFDGMETSVDVTRLVAVAPEAAYAHVLDLNHVKAMFPRECIGLFVIGERSFGEGANALVRYDMGLMHRKLPMTLVRADAPRIIDFDHVGPRGFITRWHFEPVEGGTNVRIETPLSGPPKLLLGYYHNVVKTEWEGCYATALDNLSRAVAGRPAAAKAPPAAPIAPPAPDDAFIPTSP